MIMFCWSYRQLAKALWLSLYCIRCKRQIIALLYRYAIAIVARAIVGETTMWRHIDIDQDDEDHGVVPVTIEIMTVLWRWRSKGARWSWPYHVTYFDCIWCLSFIHLIFALIDSSIIRWSLTNYQEVFSLSMHRCQSSSCPDTTWWSGVISSTSIYNGWSQFCTRRILRLNLTSLAYADMASEHGDRKVEREPYSRYDQHNDVHHWRLIHLTWWSDMV